MKYFQMRNYFCFEKKNLHVFRSLNWASLTRWQYLLLPCIICFITLWGPSESGNVHISNMSQQKWTPRTKMSTENKNEHRGRKWTPRTKLDPKMNKMGEDNFFKCFFNGRQLLVKRWEENIGGVDAMIMRRDQMWGENGRNQIWGEHWKKTRSRKFEDKWLWRKGETIADKFAVKNWTKKGLKTWTRNISTKTQSHISGILWSF